jgi:hypothetical protein
MHASSLVRSQVEDFLGGYPTLVSVGPASLVDDVVDWARDSAVDEEFVRVPHPGRSRAMFNTLVSAAERPTPVRCWQLDLMEAGLQLAQQKSKHVEYGSRLFADEGGYSGAVAELALIHRLAPIAPEFDLHRPSRGGHDYDLHLDFGDAGTVAVEVKRRRDSPLGAASLWLDVDFKKLLKSSPEFDCGLNIGLRVNEPTAEQLLGAAVLVEAVLRYRKNGKPVARLESHHVGARGFPRELVAPTSEALARSKRVDLWHADKGRGVNAIHVAPNYYHLDDPVLASVECWEGSRQVLVAGVCESQPLYSRTSRDSLGAHPQTFDVEVPEATRMGRLLDDAAAQLPAAPYSIVAVARSSSSRFIEFHPALYGEPYRNEYGLLALRGARFGARDWNHVSGALAFAVTAPVDAEHPVRFFENQAGPLIPSAVLNLLVGSVARSRP